MLEERSECCLTALSRQNILTKHHLATNHAVASLLTVRPNPSNFVSAGVICPGDRKWSRLGT